MQMSVPTLSHDGQISARLLSTNLEPRGGMDYHSLSGRSRAASRCFVMMLVLPKRPAAKRCSGTLMRGITCLFLGLELAQEDKPGRNRVQ